MGASTISYNVPDITKDLISLGIRQVGDEVLVRPTSHIDFTTEDPGALIHQLRNVLIRTLELYDFRNGMGLSAPQIGIPKSACIFGDSPTSLVSIINPVIGAISDDYEEAYEGCLSFWAHRGVVPRARTITLRGCSEDGTPIEHHFEGIMARMAQHEYDHLQGILYVSRMRPNKDTISLQEYADVKRGRTQQSRV